MHRHMEKIGGCILLMVVIGSCFACTKKETVQLKESSVEQVEKTKETTVKEDISKSIYVYICGAINKPGVYELPSESRVYQAVEKAGGLTTEADQTYLNQAEALKDGARIYVPTQGELEKEPETLPVPGEQETTDKVNINTAKKEDFMSLTGIGEAKAVAILKYREENGSFQSIEELKNIEGIKDGVFNKVKENITIE